MTLRNLLLYGTLAGLGLAKAATVVIQQSAGSSPDPINGRTEPYRFAAAISPDFSYVTAAQGWTITALASISILCFLLWIALTVRERMQRSL